MALHSMNVSRKKQRNFKYQDYIKYWDLFKIPEKEKANVWDGHTSKEAVARLREFLNL